MIDAHEQQIAALNRKRAAFETGRRIDISPAGHGRLVANFIDVDLFISGDKRSFARAPVVVADFVIADDRVYVFKAETGVGRNGLDPVVVVDVGLVANVLCGPGLCKLRTLGPTRVQQVAGNGEEVGVLGGKRFQQHLRRAAIAVFDGADEITNVRIDARLRTSGINLG